MSQPEPISCYRCGQPGHCDWIDVSTFSQGPGTEWMAGEQYCTTPGCTDEDGSRRLTPLTPAQLRQRGDEAWMRRQRALAEDR